MAKKPLTDISIRNLKPEAMPREVAVGGAHGLYLWIGTKGVKSFIMRYRLKGKPQRLTLGRWIPPEHRETMGDHMTLESARTQAAYTMSQVSQGLDPAATKRDDKHAKQQAAAETFEVVTNKYFEHVGNKKLRSAADRYAALQRRVFPVIGKKPMTEIRRSDINDLLRKIEKEAGPVMAHRTLAYMRKVFNWYAFENEKFESPIVRGTAGFLGFESVARDRILNDDEIRAVWKVDGSTFAALVKFLLLTGARRTEAAAMTWAEVKDGDWTLPAARNKVDDDFIRPLSKAAKAILDDRPKIEGNPYVLSTGRSFLSGFSKAKREFDEACGVTDWTLHDLRRTARSLLSRKECKVTPDLAEIALGHKLPGVRGVYDRHQYQEEKRQAFEALAALIERVVSPPADNVVQFPQAGE
jgi:integrase